MNESSANRSAFRRYGIVTVCLLLAALVVLFRNGRPKVELPEIDLSQAHPRVAESIQRSVDVCREKPGAASVGTLGMKLMAHYFSQEAVRCFAAAASLDPGDFRWPYLSGTILEDEDLDEALRLYREAIVLRPQYPPLRYRTGIMLMRINRMEDAEKEFRRAAELEPTSGFPFLGLGRLARVRGDLDAAQTCFEQAVSLAPWYRQAHAELARTYQQNGRLEDAAREQVAAFQLPDVKVRMPDPLVQQVEGMEVVTRSLGSTADQMMAQGRFTAAASAYRQMVAARPGLSGPLLKLAHLHWLSGNPSAAVQGYRDVIRKFPNDTLAHFSLASALEQSGHVDEAEAVYRHCLALKPDYADAHYRLGVVLEGRGQIPDAERCYQSAIEADPRNGHAHFSMALALKKRGESEAAIDHLRSAVRLLPDQPLAADVLKKTLAEAKNGN